MRDCDQLVLAGIQADYQKNSRIYQWHYSILLTSYLIVYIQIFKLAAIKSQLYPSPLRNPNITQPSRFSPYLASLHFLMQIIDRNALLYQLLMQIKKSLDRLSQQIELDPTDIHSIQMRSQVFTAEGMFDQAISDCTKLIHLRLSRQHYVNRSQLLKQKRHYLDALKDLQTAKNIQKDQEEQTAVDVYLQNSICMKNIRLVEQMAQIIESQPGLQKAKFYEQTIQQLLVVQQIQNKEAQNYKQQISQLKHHYEQQAKQLAAVFSEQLAQIKAQITHCYVNYESKLAKQLLTSQLTPSQQHKIILYFKNFSSEMEKYYIAAKNLHKIEDKTIKFQDFQNMVLNKQSANYLTKIYKLFDKYSSQVQKIEQFIEHVPYIGTTFKIVKAAMKVQGWKEQINLENQCTNIEQIAINTTSFNQFSTNLAYYAVKHYQRQIVEEKTVFKSNWELLAKKIRQLQERRLGKLQYKHQLSEEEEIVRDYAIIHASILMIGYACKQVNFSPDSMKQVNKVYQNNQKEAFAELSEVFAVIDQVEGILKQKFQNQSTPKQQASNSSSYCSIYRYPLTRLRVQLACFDLFTPLKTIHETCLLYVFSLYDIFQRCFLLSSLPLLLLYNQLEMSQNGYNYVWHTINIALKANYNKTQVNNVAV